jgi:type IV secretion system protein VirD4
MARAMAAASSPAKGTTNEHHWRERSTALLAPLLHAAHVTERPIHDLPALISEAGGQKLHVMVCLQDLSQARKRWGDDTADGFLSLFQTKLILNGIADPRTLDAISLCLGEYDRQLVSHTLGRSESKEFLEPRRPTETESVTYHTQRQRTLSPEEIARLPPGRGLLLQGTRWGLIRMTPWHRTEPWVSVASVPGWR